LWTAAVNLCDAAPIHYLCREEEGWAPDLADLEAKLSPRAKALVVINPNNPTGAVYSRSVLEGLVAIARRHDLVLMADEIYDKVLYDDAEYVPLSTLADDLLVLTFSGLSKSYRAAGFRTGRLVISGAQRRASGRV